jgi:streptogramin lyase
VDVAVATAGASTLVWVAAGREPAVYRFDPEDAGSAVERFGTGDDIPTALAVAADGTAWIVSEQSDSILAIAADGTTRVHEVLGGGCDGPTDVAVTGDQVWAACGASRAVVRVRPTDGSIADSLPVGGTPVSITADGRAAWVAVQDR